MLPFKPQQRGETFKAPQGVERLNMSAEKKKEDPLGKAAWQAIKDAIKGDRKHGWGVDDSMQVIESLIAEDGPDGYAPSDRCLELIRSVVNPSAFRQQLESKEVNLLDKPKKAERRKASLAKLADEYGD